MIMHTDEFGRLQDLRCHDGNLIAVATCDGGMELLFRRAEGTKVRAVLEGVRYFVMNQFFEGNIVDTAYLWDLASAPKEPRLSAARAFSLDETSLGVQSEHGANQLFVLECSYGATVHALVTRVSVVDCKEA